MLSGTTIYDVIDDIDYVMFHRWLEEGNLFIFKRISIFFFYDKKMISIFFFQRLICPVHINSACLVKMYWTETLISQIWYFEKTEKLKNHHNFVILFWLFFYKKNMKIYDISDSLKSFRKPCWHVFINWGNRDIQVIGTLWYIWFVHGSRKT